MVALSSPLSIQRQKIGLLNLFNPVSDDTDFLRLPGGETVSYGEARDQIRRVAGWMKESGVQPGDRVAIFVKNGAEIPILMFAAASIGAVFVVLNDQLKPRGLEKILSQAEPVLLVADESTMSSLPEGDLGIDLRILISGNENNAWTPWESVIDHPPLEEAIEIDPETAVCLVFTSGSTGSPRGVTLSHANILFVVDAIQKRLQYQPEDTIGCFLPLSFDYGLYQIFLTAISGATLFIGNPGLVGPRLPKIMKEAGITVLPGVPTVYSALISLHRRRPFELPLLRAITNTGERLPISYIEEMEKMFPGLATYVMYGLTECKRTSILLPDEFAGPKRNSVGRPLDGTEVYAVGDDGTRLPAGAVGELVVRGPHVAKLGYWRSPEETAARFRIAPEDDGEIELYTGDTGSVDKDGFIFFEARADDLLKHRGNRISPIEIETEACAIAGVVEGCIVKCKATDSLNLFVTRSDKSLTDKAILESLKTVLEPAKIPDRVHILESMPKSMNGKIDRKSLLPQLAS